MAWPHLSAWAMGCVDDPAEGGTAAAAINTVQLICGAFGAGLAGVVVNMTDRGDATAARWAIRGLRGARRPRLHRLHRAGRGRQHLGGPQDARARERQGMTPTMPGSCGLSK